MSAEAVKERQAQILVVDDRQENRFLVQSVLESSGFRVHLANNGEEALDIARLHRPDLIISDITMPKMDGFQLCRIVKADDILKDIRFVFYTATYTEEKDERFALSLGADQFLVQPIEPVELVHRVNKLIAKTDGVAFIGEHKEDVEYYREYSQRLVLKLERKLDELEIANRKLQSLNTTLEDKVTERTGDLKRKNQELATTNGELQAFAHTAAHDLRAPLRSIQGFAALMAEEVVARCSPETRSHLDRIKRSTAQMDRLVQDLLDYSKVASTQVRLLPIKLDRIVRQVVADRQIDIDEKHAVIKVKVDKIDVHGVEVLLVQLFENLLSNALKFVAPGVQPRVVIRAEVDGRIARVWVEDNGIGIPPEYKDRIFNVFERLHQQDVYPGTGIGLAIVRKAVERMGGRIHVASEVGKGTSFCIELKRALS